jgi:ribosomal protein L37AE/L43A
MSKKNKEVWSGITAWVCNDCGSTDVLAKGTMVWVYHRQDWLSNERESHFCESCASDNVGPVDITGPDVKERLGI